jgi:anti-sigma regulatory factor (Ser/Thr protein kinase)
MLEPQVERLRQELNAWMLGQGFPGETAYKVITVVDELFCNTMEYAGAAWWEVEAEIAGTGVAITLRDDGVAFDPFEAGQKDYSLYLASDTDRRLGLYLVSRLAKRMDYDRQGSVNKVSFLVEAHPPDGHRFEKKH